MMATGSMQAKFMKGLLDDTEENKKEANLLCSDAIQNFKTV